MDIYSVSMTVEEYVNLEPCGSVHPNHPDVVCIKKGKCPTDWHMAECTKHKAVVQWGKDIEDYIAKFGWTSAHCWNIVGQLLPIT